jgi:hypothetical protein
VRVPNPERASPSKVTELMVGTRFELDATIPEVCVTTLNRDQVRLDGADLARHVFRRIIMTEYFEPVRRAESRAACPILRRVFWTQQPAQIQ